MFIFIASKMHIKYTGSNPSKEAMRLTRFSDIGLRVLMYLVRSDREQPPITVAEIATQFDVPKNHLVKVVGLLAKCGWLTATRGRTGGLKLNTAPAALKLGVVLRALEGEEELIDCDTQVCTLRTDCLLRSALRHAQAEFYVAMDRYTLADITGGKTGAQISTLHIAFLRQFQEKQIA